MNMKARQSIKQAPTPRQVSPKGLAGSNTRINTTAAAPKGKSASIPLPALAGCEGVDVWITPAQAGKILGVALNGIYKLVDQERPFLITKRPLPRKILISLRSVRAFSEATRDAEFWRSAALQEEFLGKLRVMAEKV